MWFYGMQRVDLSPLFHFQRVSNTTFGPLVFLNHTSYQIDKLVVVNQTIGWINCIGKIC